MTAAIYARVSTTDQNCAMQLADMHGFTGRSGWTFVEYVDEGQSGAKSSRPALNRLMADARLRKFNVVICWKLDRFGRSMLDLLQNIQTLTDLGIRFMCPNQNIDTDQKNPIGKLTLGILAVIAEFERALIQERVKAGVAQARASGKHCGRPQRVFRRDQVQTMRSEGKSWARIASELQVPVSTIRDAYGKSGS